MATLPTSLALTNIADGSVIVAADHRNNYAAIQAEANALLTILAGGAAGQVLTGVGTTLVWGPAVTTYTPAWTSTGTLPALGNGTLVGSYVQIGKLVVASLTLTCGTTTTYGTGTYSFSLPVSPAVVGNMAGSGIVQNTGGANASLVNWRTSGDVALNQLAFAQMTATVPITLASGSSLNMTLAYIAA